MLVPGLSRRSAGPGQRPGDTGIHRANVVPGFGSDGAEFPSELVARIEKAAPGFAHVVPMLGSDGGDFLPELGLDRIEFVPEFSLCAVEELLRPADPIAFQPDPQIAGQQKHDDGEDHDRK
ncbi:MAG: hypothetical protein F4Y03_11420, partial [Alphaproteobacteria bacterium]|nr:hypothetical protein [Alphaproteobacteria bacterium]